MEKTTRLPEKRNKITRDLIMGLVFDSRNLVGGKFFTRLHDIARQAGIDDEDFDAWYKELLQERNENLMVIPKYVADEVEDDETCWPAAVAR